MRTRMILWAMLSLLLSAAVAPTLSACSSPPVRAAIGYTWAPGGQDDVFVSVGNVPSVPAGTAVSNWSIAFLNTPGICYGPYFSTAGPFDVEKISMSFGPITSTTTGDDDCVGTSTTTCVSRGLTNLPTATFSGGRLSGVTMIINSSMTATAAITEVVAHEIGHTMALLDCNYPSCPVGSSVMESNAPASSINATIGQPGPTLCDLLAITSVATDYLCSPPPPPPPPDDPCPPTDGEVQPVCSPIILDIDGKGFNLTSAAGGVVFDISGTGHPVQMGWTAEGADNAFLALPGVDGLVHDGKQLFGNFTPQPASKNPNGFAALAVYDDPKNGGNGDGIIDFRDAIYPYLRLWIDANHDGICQPEELHTLPSLGVYSISLNYKADRRTDQYGNVFRYRAPVDPNDPAQVGRTAYDVFFVTLPPTSTRNLVPLRPSPASVQKCPVPAPTKGGLSTTGTLR